MGSLSSVYALQTSWQLTNSSKRSVMPGSSRCLRAATGPQELVQSDPVRSSHLMQALSGSRRKPSLGSLAFRLSREAAGRSFTVKKIMTLAVIARLQRKGMQGVWHRGALLGQRRHEPRVVADERGVDALALQQLPDQLVQQARGGARRRALHAALRALQARRARVRRLHDDSNNVIAPASSSSSRSGAQQCAHMATRLVLHMHDGRYGSSFAYSVEADLAIN